MKTIVVLGVGLGGAPLIRQLMRTVVLKQKDYKLVVVNPSTHFHFPIAMPRVVVPDQMPDDKVMYALEPHFKEYPADKFQFILGSAANLDPKNKVVTVDLNDGKGQTSFSYNTLFIATGSSARDQMPWKLVGTAKNTTDRLHELRSKISGASKIVVAGGGLTGTETAAELGFLYSKTGAKKVYFVYNDELPLSSTAMGKVRKQAKLELERMNVKLIPNTKVVGVTIQGKSSILQLEGANGETTTLTAQAYLPTTGVVPNTSFVPQHMLDSNGYIKQTSLLRAEGYKDIFVVGDAGNLQPNMGGIADAQAAHVIKNLPAYFESGEVAEYKYSTTPMFAVTLGQSKGSGQVGSFKLFSFLVWFLKGRDMGTSKAQRIAAGKQSLVSTFEK